MRCARASPTHNNTTTYTQLRQLRPSMAHCRMLSLDLTMLLAQVKCSSFPTLNADSQTIETDLTALLLYTNVCAPPSTLAIYIHTYKYTRVTQFSLCTQSKHAVKSLSNPLLQAMLAPLRGSSTQMLTLPTPHYPCECCAFSISPLDVCHILFVYHSLIVARY